MAVGSGQWAVAVGSGSKARLRATEPPFRDAALEMLAALQHARPPMPDFESLLRITVSPAELIARGTLMYWFLFLLLRFVLRRDEWISDGLFAELEDICLRAYDQIVGLDLGDVTVDGCIVKAPCGGEAAGKSPVDRGKLGTKRSLLVDSTGVPLGCVVAPANRHDSPLLRPTLEKLARFDEGLGVGLPDQITVHLDAGYDSTKTRDLLEELGCHGVISVKGFPLQAGARWVVERTNSWHNRGFRKLAICTERCSRVIEAFIALANAVIITRRLIAQAWITHRWESRPARRP